MSKERTMIDKGIFDKLVLLSFFFIFIVYFFATSESQYAKASLSNPTPRPIQIQPSGGTSIDNIDPCAGSQQNQCTNDIWCLWNGERGHCHWRVFSDGQAACFCIPDSHVYTPTPTPTPSPTPLSCGNTHPQCNGVCPDNEPHCKNEGAFCACHPNCTGPSGAAPSCGNGVCPDPEYECHYPDSLHAGCWCGPSSNKCSTFGDAEQCEYKPCLWEAQGPGGVPIKQEGSCRWAFGKCFCDPGLCGDAIIDEGSGEECDCGNGNLDCTAPSQCGQNARCRSCKCEATL